MEETPDTFDTNVLSCIHLEKFSQNRRKEIEVMKRALAASGSGTKLSFQRLPKHMRRRAMSHNVKRLPRRLREIHLNQMKKSGLPPKLKRPSRKYRRKPRNLLEEYSKRQAKYKWLNTHIWHAKRFHMVEKWGYKLPNRPCDKAFTACYRATKNYCLIQDISYFQCIEITGNRQSILDGFEKITDRKIGLSIGSRAFIRGTREGEIILHQQFSDLKRPIGPVQFLWRYNGEDTNTTDVLWLWVHAAFYEDVISSLMDSLGFMKSTNENFVNKEGIILKELRNELNRFRLIGNLSNSILHKFLRIYKSLDNSSDSQNDFWNKIKVVHSVNNLSPHLILPLIVYDPRLLPSANEEEPECHFNTDIVPFCEAPTSAISPLWKADLRKQINSSKVSNKEISTIQNSLLIPSKSTAESGSPVAIILIQKPGSTVDNLGYSSGWDIIVPASWAQPFWLSLIMNGARSGGLREFQHNNFEIGKPNYLYPDTPAGEREDEHINSEYVNTYFRKPPNKRTNFNKLKIVSPFCCNWKLLIENWLGHSIDFFTVLRDRKRLVALQKSIQVGNGDIELDDNCLIPVKVECSKGCPERYTIICIAQLKDLIKCPAEGKCVDSNQLKRKLLRKEHKALLKRLRQKRRRKETNQTDSDIENLAKYSTEMKNLWLPIATDIRNSCSREICGFVTEGGFSYILGNTKGIGYIAGAAIKTIINSGCKDRVLTRNTNSRQYFLAKMSVIADL